MIDPNLSNTGISFEGGNIYKGRLDCVDANAVHVNWSCMST